MFFKETIESFASDRVSVLGVADCAVDAGDVVADAGVLLAADADRPVHGGAAADAVRPLFRDLREVVREDETRTGTVGTAHDRDAHARQLHARIQSFDARIIPSFDFAEENICESCLVEFQCIRFHAAQIHDHDHAAGEHRELAEVRPVELFFGQRIVGTAEIDGFLLDLVDSGTGTAALIVDFDAVSGRFSVIVAPDPVDRGGKRRAGTVERDLGGGYGKRQQTLRQPCKTASSYALHV